MENTLDEKGETGKPHLDVRNDFSDKFELMMRLDLLFDFFDELVGRVELVERFDRFACKFRRRTVESKERIDQRDREIGASFRKQFPLLLQEGDDFRIPAVFHRIMTDSNESNEQKESIRWIDFDGKDLNENESNQLARCVHAGYDVFGRRNQQ